MILHNQTHSVSAIQYGSQVSLVEFVSADGSGFIPYAGAVSTSLVTRHPSEYEKILPCSEDPDNPWSDDWMNTISAK